MADAAPLLVITDVSKLSDRQLAEITLERIIAMSQIVTDTDAAVAAENTKVDQLIALVQPAITSLQQQLATAQAQVAALQAGDAADASTLAGTLAAAQSETAKVQTAITALGGTPAGGSAKTPG